jgi:hypothetical protein
MIFFLNLHWVQANQCKSYLAETNQIDHRLIRISKALLESKKIIFFDGSQKIKPSLVKLLSTSWTLILDSKIIILGTNIPGENGIIGGSHSHLTLSKYASIEPNSARMSGSVKFNPNGTLFISGYHNKSFDFNSERMAIDAFRNIIPSLSIVSSPDRLFSLKISEQDLQLYQDELSEALSLFSDDFMGYDQFQLERVFLLAIKFQRFDILERVIPLISWRIVSANRDDHWLVDLLKINGSEYLINYFRRDIPLVLNQEHLNDLNKIYFLYSQGFSIESVFEYFLNIQFDIYYSKLDFKVFFETGDLRLFQDFLKSGHWRDLNYKYKLGVLRNLISHPRRLVTSDKNRDLFVGVFKLLSVDFLNQHKDSLKKMVVDTKNQNAIQALELLSL